MRSQMQTFVDLRKGRYLNYINAADERELGKKTMLL